MGGREWNERYAGGPPPEEAPAALLDEIAELLPPSGTMVDVAGGMGRNARWFARRGFEVTVIDVSEVALAHAATTARNEGQHIECIELDLEEGGLPTGRTWDVALVHFFYDRTLLATLPQYLAAEGVLVFAQPTITNLERHPRPSARFLLDAGELAEVAEGLTAQGMEVLRIDEAWRSSGRHEGWLVARRW